MHVHRLIATNCNCIMAIPSQTRDLKINPPVVFSLGHCYNGSLTSGPYDDPIHRWVFKVHIPTVARIELVSALADLEHRLNFGTSEKLQLGSLVSAFAHARTAIIDAAA